MSPNSLKMLINVFFLFFSYLIWCYGERIKHRRQAIPSDEADIFELKNKYYYFPLVTQIFLMICSLIFFIIIKYEEINRGNGAWSQPLIVPSRESSTIILIVEQICVEKSLKIARRIALVRIDGHYFYLKKDRKSVV